MSGAEDRAKVYGPLVNWVALLVTLGSIFAGGFIALGVYKSDMNSLKQSFASLMEERKERIKAFDVWKSKTDEDVTTLKTLVPVVKEQLSEIKNEIKNLQRQKAAYQGEPIFGRE